MKKKAISTSGKNKKVFAFVFDSPYNILTQINFDKFDVHGISYFDGFCEKTKKKEIRYVTDKKGFEKEIASGFKGYIIIFATPTVAKACGAKILDAQKTEKGWVKVNRAWAKVFK